MKTNWSNSVPEDVGKVAGFLATIRDAVNVCLGAARALSKIKGVGGISATVSGGNVVIDGTQMLSRVQSIIDEIQELPWRLTAIDVETREITVDPGMVNNTIPTIGGTSLVVIPKPQLALTSTASGVIYIRLTVDAAGAITDAIIGSASTMPADTTTGTLYKYKLIGTYTTSAGDLTSLTWILKTNQSFYMCGNTPIWD